MSIIFTETQMDGQPAVEQAKRAIHHVLSRIHDDPHTGYLLGIGTQSFDLLTEAYATLYGRDIKEVREHFNCKNAKNPVPKRDDQEEACSADVTDWMTTENILSYMEEMVGVDRLELLDRITDRFCRRCGGDQRGANQCNCIRAGLKMARRRI